MAIPKLIEKEDPKRMQVIGEFMKDHCTNFFGLLTQNFLDTGDGKAVITIHLTLVVMSHHVGRSPDYVHFIYRGVRHYCLGRHGDIDRKGAAKEFCTQPNVEDGGGKLLVLR